MQNGPQPQPLARERLPKKARSQDAHFDWRTTITGVKRGYVPSSGSQFKFIINKSKVSLLYPIGEGSQFYIFNDSRAIHTWELSQVLHRPVLSFSFLGPLGPLSLLYLFNSPRWCGFNFHSHGRLISSYQSMQRAHFTLGISKMQLFQPSCFLAYNKCRLDVRVLL